MVKKQGSAKNVLKKTFDKNEINDFATKLSKWGERLSPDERVLLNILLHDADNGSVGPAKVRLKGGLKELTLSALKTTVGSNNFCTKENRAYTEWHRTAVGMK
jgi:hypothetical protein